MKNINYLMVIAFTVLIAGCSGSETYRGEWKATDEEGVQLEITFYENSLSIKKEGDSAIFDYTQNSINIENAVETYGINLEDGRSYLIHFPIANDESKGVIKDPNGNVLYAISRSDYLKYEDLYKLK